MTNIYVITHDDPYPEDRSVEFFASDIDHAKELVKHKVENGWNELSIYIAELDSDEYWLDRSTHLIATGSMENGKFAWLVKGNDPGQMVDDF